MVERDERLSLRFPMCPPLCIIYHLGAVGGLQNVASCEAAARARLLLGAGGRAVASGSPSRYVRGGSGPPPQKKLKNKK